MSYQVKKTIEFNNSYEKPVNILKGAILEKDDGERVIQLKLCNTGDDILNKVSVNIICLSEDEQVLGTQKYEYQKIFVKPGEVFGTDIAIPLQYNDTNIFSVEFDSNESLQIKNFKRKKEKSDIPTTFFNFFSGLVFFINLLFTVLLVWSNFEPGVETVSLMLQVVPGILFPCVLIQTYFNEDKQYNMLKFLFLFFFILICLFPFLGGWSETEVYRTSIIIMMWILLIGTTIWKRKKDIKLIIVLFIMFMVGMYFTSKATTISSELIRKIIEDIDNESILAEIVYFSMRGNGIDSLYNSCSFIISSNNLQIPEFLKSLEYLSGTKMDSDYYLAMRLLQRGNILRSFSILGIYLWSLLKLIKIKFKILPPKRERKL